jgi:hypothetical protein
MAAEGNEVCRKRIGMLGEIQKRAVCCVGWESLGESMEREVR